MKKIKKSYILGSIESTREDIEPMTIVSEILEKLKACQNLSEVEECFSLLFCELFIDYLGHCLELLDKFLIQSYLADGWTIDRLEERQLTFLFGTVTFKRRRLRKKDEKSFIPLDRALGLEPRQHFSPLFKEKIAQLSTGMTYRQAASSIELLTNQTISHQTVHTIAQSVAEKIQRTSEPEPRDKRKPEFLYIEADGVWIGSQEKGKHLEYKRGFIHEGVEKVGNRRCLINPVYFGCFGTSKDLFEEIRTYLAIHYDLSRTLIIANSDGGSGYEADKFQSLGGRRSLFEYCLDSYHVMRYLTGKLGFDKFLQKELRQAVKAYNYERVELLLDTAESYLEQEEHLERLGEVRSYLTRNWCWLQPLKDRDLPVRDGVGVCESGHRYYTNRMKRQGRNWTRRGAENMATLLVSIRNGEFESLYRATVSEPVFREEIAMSVSKALKVIKHKEHTIPQATIPVYGAKSSAIGVLSGLF